MGALRSNRGSQYTMVAEFVFDVSTAVADSMPTVVGNVIGGAVPVYNAVGQALGGFYAGVAQIYDVIGLPPNAIIINGELVVESAVVGPTASGITVGDLNSAARYLGSTSLLATGRTPLVPTGYLGVGENIRITITNTVAVATAGKVSLRVFYVVRGRAQEVQIS